MIYTQPGLNLQADPPNPAQLPQDDIVGVTVMLLTCSYNQQVSAWSHRLNLQTQVSCHSDTPLSHFACFQVYQIMQEFIRVGYYVSTEYWDEELREMEPPPNPPLIDRYMCDNSLKVCSPGLAADATCLLQIVSEYSGRQAQGDQIPCGL